MSVSTLPRRRRRSTPRKRLIDKLDDLCRQIIRKRDVVCQRCGKHPLEGKLDTAHIIPRQYLGTRWDLINLVLLCVTCHSMGRDSWHENPVAGVKWFTEKFPARKRYLETVQKVRQWKVWELEALVRQLQIKLDELNSKHS